MNDDGLEYDPHRYPEVADSDYTIAPFAAQAPVDELEQRAKKRYKETLAAMEPVNSHIDKMWLELMRSPEHYYLGGLEDKKVEKHSSGRDRLYYPPGEEVNVTARLALAKVRVLGVLERVNKARREHGGEITSDEAIALFDRDLDKSLAYWICARNVRSERGLSEFDYMPLPAHRERGAARLGAEFCLNPAVNEHGLIYVPNTYIVPGPRFNEVYGWDSAFVADGLLQQGHFNAAKEMVDGMLYQIKHYGAVLNGNRTYYYDTNKPRSQPPMVTGKILSVYQNLEHVAGYEKPEARTAWLAHAAEMAEKYHEFWMTPPHYDEKTKLSRYASDLGTPSGEVNYCEPDHYPQALEALQKMHEAVAAGTNAAPEGINEDDWKLREYYLARFYKPAKDGQPDALTEEFYKGDRAMRESGFDPSGRFGFFNADASSYLPVCLNSLRYKHEWELSQIYQKLGNNEKQKEWAGKAEETKQAMNKWLWDDGKAEDGTVIRPAAFRDRHIDEDMQKRYGVPEFRDYNFASAFFPMWVGVATKPQAESIMQNIYPKLRAEKGGLFTSDKHTGGQWDWPMVWMPLVVAAATAMEKYNFYHEALDVSCNCLDMIKKDFSKTGKLFEKYEGRDGTSDTQRFVGKGYGENVEGFAWTNAGIIQLQYGVKRLVDKIVNGHTEEPEIPVHQTVVTSGSTVQRAHEPVNLGRPG